MARQSMRARTLVGRLLNNDFIGLHHSVKDNGDMKYAELRRICHFFVTYI